MVMNTFWIVASSEAEGAAAFPHQKKFKALNKFLQTSRQQLHSQPNLEYMVTIEQTWGSQGFY